METALGGTPGREETDRPQGGRTDEKNHGEPETTGTLALAGWGCQGKLPVYTEGATTADAGMRQTGPRGVCSRHRRTRNISERKVVIERFGGPLAGLVGHLSVQRRWRAEAGRAGRESEMLQDLPDNCRAFDDGDDPHRPAAAWSQRGVGLVDLYCDEVDPSSMAGVSRVTAG